MIFRGADFFDVVWLLPHHLPPSTRRLRKRENLLSGEGVEEEPNYQDGEKP
jgi:hypothetical protein